MGFAQIRGELTTRVGRPVRYGAPLDVHGKGGSHIEGKVLAEVWAEPELNKKPPHTMPCDEHCWGDYSFCSQLLQMNDGRRQLRIAYYRRRCGENHWEYASQMTATGDPDILRRLLERTLEQIEWFTQIEVQR
jgi:hypothetical protein